MAPRSASQFSTDSLSRSTLPLLCARVITTFHSASAVLGSGDFRLIVYCTTLPTPRWKPTSHGPSSPLQLSSTRVSTPTRLLWALLDSKRNLSTKSCARTIKSERPVCAGPRPAMQRLSSSHRVIFSPFLYTPDLVASVSGRRLRAWRDARETRSLCPPPHVTDQDDDNEDEGQDKKKLMQANMDAR